MKRYKWFWILVAVFLLPVATAYAVDRLFLGPTCPACHAEITKKLPLFDPSREGLVRIRANGMEFRARVAGFSNHEGEGVILLHGFPETSIIWEALMDKLAKAGFRAVAFDQRGYSPGARPFGVNSYSSGRLAGDVIAIATAVGFDRFHVVGHDFGGAIAWIAARRLIPKRLPKSFERFQCPMSSYFLLYWIPVLPELALGFNRAAYLQRLKWELHPAKQIEEYKQVFSEAGASRSVLNWYRAFRFRSTDPLGKIRQPTLFLWGNEDEAFSHVAAVKTADHVEGPFRFYRLKAGHLLILELPELAADKVLSHLRTWSQESEEWKLVQANAPDESASSCDQSKPHCLSIFVAPDGNAVRIRNRCSQRYQGVVRVYCTGWAPKTFVEYRFSLGARGDVIQESNGISSGECYYRHQLCPMQLQE